MNKYWKDFVKSGKIDDYLKYKEEFAKDKKIGSKNADTKSNSPKDSKLQRDI